MTQTAQAQTGADYAIQAELPANQIKGRETYLNLLVKPGTEQAITVSIINLSKQTKKIKVIPTNATTQDNGLVSYAPSRLRDPSAKYQFTELTSKAVTVSLGPEQVVPVTFKTRIPKDGFTGQILGGIYASDPTIHEGAEGGLQINNRFAYSIAVMLQTDQTLVPPELKLNSVRPGIQSNQVAVLANLSNVAPRLFGKISYESKLYRNGSKTVTASRKVQDYSFAPNSAMTFATWANKNEALKPGRYELDLTAKSGTKTWHWRRDFVIARSKIRELKKELGQEEPFPWLWLIAAGGLLLLIIFLIIILLKRRKKDGDDDDQNATPTT